MESAEEITKKAKSNLAIALACLPRERRADMVVFYAFCRVIDDLADDTELSKEEKFTGLNEWKDCLNSKLEKPNRLQQQVLDLRDRYEIKTEYFTELIEGCLTDLTPQRFGNWEELQKYTYRVACCVGLISIKVFGCTHPDSETYALKLGHALQLTNILRDVGEDLTDNVRIYLPLNDMDRFQYTERDLVGRVYDGRFIAMMDYHTQRAEDLYAEAVAALPREDKNALKAAEAMRKIYFAILQKMKADRYQVFDKRYSLSKPRKIWSLFSTMIGMG